MSTVPFDPLDYLAFARAQASATPSEAALRAAVSRAYYALFLITVTNLRMKHQRGQRGSLHTRAINAVKNRKGHKSIGEKLQELYDLRCAADYQLLPDDVALRDWSRNWEDADALVDDILETLEKLHP